MTGSDTFIAWLDEPGAATVSRTGGKGASLARLGGAGFPVPPGFVVTAEAYRAFHQALDMAALVAALPSAGTRSTPAEVQESCAPVLAMLRSAGLPEHLRAQICDAVAQLEARCPQPSIAVRSSGVNEDGAAASFAGLYESYLNLSGVDSVLRAVLDCYRSLWDPRAVHYRAMKGVDHAREAMAAVVMQTVSSAISGVAFTLNPVTGSTDEVMVNSSWGLGEAIVSGAVTPDSFLALKDGRVISSDVAFKEVRVVATPGGTQEEPTPPELAEQRTLDDTQLGTVVETAVAIEKEYGCPVDIEFAFDDAGTFYVLQARPVTTR